MKTPFFLAFRGLSRRPPGTGLVCRSSTGAVYYGDNTEPGDINDTA